MTSVGRLLSNAAGRLSTAILRLIRPPNPGASQRAAPGDPTGSGAGRDRYTHLSGDREPAAAASSGLGVEITALGPRAAAVFAASGRIRDLDDLTRVVVADHAELGAGLPASVVVVSLNDLAPSASVPALDPSTTNPVGWKPACDPAGTPPRGQRPQVSRSAHHVDDWTGSWHDPAARAGELAAAAATGAVVRVLQDSPELESYLGTELYSLMADGDRIADAGSHTRESLSIAMRRAALRDHSLPARTRQVLSAADVEGPRLPLVSVLVPTRRPDRLAAVVDAVAAQTYPRVELVLALHGEGFPRSTVDTHLGRLTCPTQSVRVPDDRSLGDVLNTALAASGGDKIAKFDDDDLYGPHHLWDLVLASEYSGAALVGKGSEYVYLAGADRTIRRFAGRGERYIDPTRSSVAGAASMADREAIDAVGGWRPMGVGEDRALAQDIAAGGGRVYRMHGAGFLAMRHGIDHTWDVDDSYFLAQAQDARDGCDLEFAGTC